MSNKIKYNIIPVKSISVIFAVMSVVLLLALLPMPYGYYTFTRILICLSAAWLSYKHWGTIYHMNNLWFWIFGVIAILFNPFIKIQLARETWMMIDGLLGIMFAILAYYSYHNQKVINH